MRVIHLLRKPLSERSVATNVLKHGTGALNIEACRIGYLDESDLNLAKSKNPGSNTLITTKIYGSNRPQQSVHPEGRWPSNVILQHQPGCQETGVERVDSNGHYPKSRGRGSQVSGPSGHKGQEDLPERHTKGEVVVEWVCDLECPVSDLNVQTTDMKASRFFKQVVSRRVK